MKVARRIGVLLRKEWTEQRRLLLIVLAALCILWAGALTAALAAGPGAWLRLWSWRLFPAVFLGTLLPVHALLAGCLGFGETRLRGTREFLLALPVEAREVAAAALTAAGGAVCVTAGAGWGLQGLLLALGGPAPPGPPPFPLQSAAAGLLVTVVALLPPLAAGAAAGASTRTTPRALLLAAVLAASLGVTTLLVCIPLARWGWWVPPWSLATLAGAALLATAAVARFEQEGGAAISKRWVAAGVTVALALVAGAAAWGGAWSVPPSQADRIDPSPRQGRHGLLFQVSPQDRLWRWDLEQAIDGRPADALPGRDAAVLGWGPEGDELYWTRRTVWGAEDLSEIMVSELGGGVRRLLTLHAPTPPGPEALVIGPGGRPLVLDRERATIWDLRTGKPLARIEGARGFAGFWAGLVLLDCEEGVRAWDPAGGETVTLAFEGELLPLRSGAWLAILSADGELGLLERDADLRMLASGVGSAQWAHHLTTLYYREGTRLMAWHPEVGPRELATGIEDWSVLPGGTRLLVLRGGRGRVLHAGSRREAVIDLQPATALFRAGSAAVSPDGGWMAVAAQGRYHLVDLATGDAQALPVSPAAGGTDPWVAWLPPLPDGDRSQTPDAPSGWVVLRRDRVTYQFLDMSHSMVIRSRLGGGVERSRLQDEAQP